MIIVLYCANAVRPHHARNFALPMPLGIYQGVTSRWRFTIHTLTIVQTNHCIHYYNVEHCITDLTETTVASLMIRFRYFSDLFQLETTFLWRLGNYQSLIISLRCIIFNSYILKVAKLAPYYFLVTKLLSKIYKYVTIKQ